MDDNRERASARCTRCWRAPASAPTGRWGSPAARSSTDRCWPARAGAATFGWFPLINTLDLTLGAGGQGFKFAWISDTHLYPKDVNTRFVDKAVRAVKEVQAMKPAADFLIFGGDLAQLGDPGRARPREPDPEGGEDQEGLHPGRARLVPRHGPEVDEAVRRAELVLRPQGRPLRRARHGEPRPGLLDGEEDVAQGADGPHGHARRERRRARGPASAATSSSGCSKTLSELGQGRAASSSSATTRSTSTTPRGTSGCGTGAR